MCFLVTLCPKAEPEMIYLFHAHVNIIITWTHCFGQFLVLKQAKQSLPLSMLSSSQECMFDGKFRR